MSLRTGREAEIVVEIGSIPSAYYATTDDESFKKFISRCDILVASLPSTQATHFLLKAEHFSKLFRSKSVSSDRQSLDTMNRGHEERRGIGECWSWRSSTFWYGLPAVCVIRN